MSGSGEQSSESAVRLSQSQLSLKLNWVTHTVRSTRREEHDSARQLIQLEANTHSPHYTAPPSLPPSMPSDTRSPLPSSTRTRSPPRPHRPPTFPLSIRKMILFSLLVTLYSLYAIHNDYPPWNWLEDWRHRGDKVVLHRPGFKKVQRSVSSFSPPPPPTFVWIRVGD